MLRSQRLPRKPVARRLGVTLGLTAAVLALTSTSQGAASVSRPFSSISPWNAPIAEDPQLDARSAEMVGKLSAAVHPGVANLYDFGTPVYTADSETPRYRIDCLVTEWGPCPLERQAVPIPVGAKPAPGSDGQLTVVDVDADKAYCLWQYRDDHRTASWGGAFSTTTDGVAGNDKACSGAGTPSIAGLVRLHEVRQGKIDHALALSTKFCQAGTYRFPATKTDGTYTGAGAVPEGARLQLDPKVNVDAIPGITAGEKMVARALQTYGAYVVDCGGANMAFAFEHPMHRKDPYPEAGLSWDYFGMDRIPWQRMRVLSSWKG